MATTTRTARDDLHRAANGTAQRDTEDHREGQRDGQRPDDDREEHAVPDAPVGARTPEPRRSANRARPTLDNPAVTNVTVAARRRADDPRSAVPPLTARNTQSPAMAASPGPSATSAMRSSSTRHVRGPAQEGEPEQDPAPGACRSDRQARPRPERPPVRAGRATRSAPRRPRSPPAASDRRAGRGPPTSVRTRSQPGRRRRRRASRAAPRPAPAQTLDQYVDQAIQAASSSAAASTAASALRRRVRAHRRSASRDRGDIRHSACRAERA